MLVLGRTDCVSRECSSLVNLVNLVGLVNLVSPGARG